MSVEDKAFFEIMDRKVFMDDSNSWVVPLLFGEPRRRHSNNRMQKVKRLATLCQT